MKNLLHKDDDIDRIEELPLRERNHDYSWENDDYWGKDFPYRRIMRWLESQEGNHIDSVIHKFVNLKWLLPIYRTLGELRRKIEMDTFIEDGKVCFYSSWCYWGKRGPHRIVEDEGSKTIYVHPKTCLVCVHRPSTKESWKKQEQEKLDKKLRILGDFHQLYKQNGIWYEVKAGPIDREDSEFRNRKPHLGWGNKLKPKDIILETKLGFMPTFKIILKRQLNKKELKTHNLTNG
jgi:hypothetical protein